jgi:cobalamin synthase
MKRDPHDSAQAMQRVKVGLVGLAAVVLLIGLAGIVLSALRSAAVPGSDPALVANAAAANVADSDNEPLADLGVAPGADPVGNAR